MGAAPIGRGGVGAMGTPGLGAGGMVRVPGGEGAAGEPAAGVEPGIGGVGRREGFFFSSGLPASPPSDDDNLTIHHFVIAGCSLR